MTGVSRLGGGVTGGRRSILDAYRRVPHNAVARGHGSVLDAGRRLPGGLPIPVVVGVTTALGGGTLAIPAGTVAGDLLLLQEGNADARAGWATLSSDSASPFYWRLRTKTAGAGEPAIALPGGPTAVYSAICVAVRGCSPTTPIAVVEPNHAGTTYTTSPPSVPSRAVLTSPSAGLALWLHTVQSEDAFTMTLPTANTRLFAAAALFAHAFSEPVTAGALAARTSTVGGTLPACPAWHSVVVLR